MKDYIVYTDSACDIDPKILAEWGVSYSSLTFRFDDSEKEFYRQNKKMVDLPLNLTSEEQDWLDSDW